MGDFLKKISLDYTYNFILHLLSLEFLLIFYKLPKKLSSSVVKFYQKIIKIPSRNIRRVPLDILKNIPQ